ncbi:HD domain-containing protein [Aureibacter tunicatorum]|uniref:HD domain-containing protein n=1 Tax=Aureibacter tunicatorum TaxID=866807 RepID=A0AAE3XU06_9BACT|nr:HD domain-containing protein [Aureibacter tunicatorum]MDR6242063.1 hypothetical protein [Aureibacter tunicatorum]
MKKKKIINDPLYGLIDIPDGLVFELIEHPYFQRLRRIKQLGLTDYVYPGAFHTRFQHALGAMHLMRKCLSSLKAKGVLISDDEMEGAMVAILLHDIGHGPFSHALEFSLMKNISHEHVSISFMNQLNDEFGGRLDLAIKMFKGRYEREFFHQLISSQLDVDRIDYLNRDSFYSGVMEGRVGADRIIKLLNVVDDQLVLEEKGIYSVENFLIARRHMYWQVYLHKASVCAEAMLVSMINRARCLLTSGKDIPGSTSLKYFLSNEVDKNSFNNRKGLMHFNEIDDCDITYVMKLWSKSEDVVLKVLSTGLLDRSLFKVEIMNEPVSKMELTNYRCLIDQYYDIELSESDFFLLKGELSNKTYVVGGQDINVLTKKGEIKSIIECSELSHILAQSKIVKKYYICWPKMISL